MERKFFIKAQTVEKKGRCITGLALPFGVVASPEHPAFAPGKLLNDNLPLPLLVDHDYERRCGEVVRIWEGGEGLHYMALLDGDAESADLPFGVSVGATVKIGDDGNVISYYVNELSLTNIPAYPKTSVTIVAHNPGNPFNMNMRRLQEIKEELLAKRQKLTANAGEQQHQTKAVKAQAPEELMSIIEDASARVAALEEQHAAALQRIDAAEQAIADIMDKLASVTDVTTEAVSEVQASAEKTINDAMQAIDSRTNDFESSLKAMHSGLQAMLEAVKKLKNN